MTRRVSAALLALGLAHAVAAQEKIEKPQPPPELYRIRIPNHAGGAVEISTDVGVNWAVLGHVNHPASALSVSSDIISVAPESAVSAVTPDHLTLRIPAAKGAPRSLQIAAAGMNATSAAITTDIPIHSGLFRYLAPPVGSRVLLLRGEKADPLPTGYLPRPGDSLIISVPRLPEGVTTTVTIENRPGGDVTLAATGGAPRVVAKVKQPLRGIGRYSSTERVASGSVLSWSPTTVLVSTSGTARGTVVQGMPPEERGGFVIQPAEPTLRGTTHPASQLLIAAVPDGDATPLISPFFGLPALLTTGDPLDTSGTRVEVRIDGGGWEAFPDVRGTVDPDGMVKALQAALGGKRTIKNGISHLRIVFGSPDAKILRRKVQLASTPLEPQPQRGSVKITAAVMGEGIAFVTFYLDGEQAKVTNIPPYTWEWDTSKVTNGEHLVEIRGLDKNGAALTTVVRKLLVDN